MEQMLMQQQQLLMQQDTILVQIKEIMEGKKYGICPHIDISLTKNSQENKF